MSSALYTIHAEQYAAVVEDNIYNSRYERPSLQALLPTIQGKTVLDLGCGSGVYAQWLLEQGALRVRCIDNSAEMIKIIQSRFSSGVDGYVQDLAQGMPQESSDTYDLVICPLMLHYIEDWRLLFNDICRVLKTGGQFCFSVHHPFADFQDSPSDNYFERELITTSWDTIGTPVEVKFYRRTLTDMVQAITDSGLLISGMNEGKASPEMALINPPVFEYLSKNPNFLFFRCLKL